MSKRGYNSNSRYNPNKISSNCIKIIKYLKENELSEFFPGFFDSRKKKSRLSRIRAKRKLIDEFRKVKLNDSYFIHHEKREFIYLYKNNTLNEYNDNFKTHELREILELYNKTDGFLTEYSKSTASEDMAEIFSHLMFFQDKIYMDDQIIEKKIQFIKNNILRIDNTFTFR